MSWKYIAGFFDGEGSIVFNGKGYRLTIPQTNEEVLLSIKNYLNYGNILKERKRKTHWKDSWVYYISQQKLIYKFLKNVQKHVIVKRNLILEVLPKLECIINRQKERKKIREKRIITILKLREKGLSYRKIELKLSLDRGYIRRLVLASKNMEALV
ncbi:MAG: LAGLIDADG family homing endonuclease [Patescibacteria group bacterium]